MKVLHILNGDALLPRVQAIVSPEEEILVFRECLIEGPRRADSGRTFAETRLDYLKMQYGLSGEQQREHLAMYKKLQTLDTYDFVGLWFEDDLFCQANLWYIASQVTLRCSALAWIRPDMDNRYSFATMPFYALEDSHLQPLPLLTPELDLFQTAWRAYSLNDQSLLHRLIDDEWLGIDKALGAELNRLDIDEDGVTKDMRQLRAVVDELGKEDLGAVLKAFAARHPEYGYGDVQVARLMEGV